MSQIWRCPECETINSSEKCVVCGEKRPAEKISTTNMDIQPVQQSHLKQSGFANNTSDQQISNIQTKNTVLESSENNERGHGKTIIIVLVVLAVIGALVFAYLRNNSHSQPAVTGTTSATTTSATAAAVTTVTEPFTDMTSETTAEMTVTVESKKEYKVPSLIYKTRDEAVNLLERMGINYELIYTKDTRVDKNCVFKQSHKSGTMITEDTVLKVYINTYERTEETTTSLITTTAPKKTTSKTTSAPQKRSISINKPNVEVDEGESVYVTVTAKGSHKISVSSSNKKAVTASWSGNWDGDKIKLKISVKKKSGSSHETIKVYFTDNPSEYASCGVTIYQEVEPVPTETSGKKHGSTFTILDSKILPVGYTVDLSESTLPNGSKWSDYYWMSTDTNVVAFRSNSATFDTVGTGECLIRFVNKNDSTIEYFLQIVVVLEDEYY